MAIRSSCSPIAGSTAKGSCARCASDCRRRGAAPERQPEMNARRVLVGIFAIVFCACVQAADKPCSAADAATAEKAIDRVVGWAQLQKAYQDYKHCDKESVGEAYTD